MPAAVCEKNAHAADLLSREFFALPNFFADTKRVSVWLDTINFAPKSDVDKIIFAVG